ncbi:hypothetical protein M569_12553 [Genlisea aurea]|uniref:Wall-associated receptor kinase galacturonan-binding domain-containing protein n=1 Tax=Genlisea aurea TaxID=192259 RepID=S8DR02_9LAMI|nr:hypothetical protein M569_12553 [Genlisea aurea]
MAMSSCIFFFFLFSLAVGDSYSSICRSVCGNLTVAYPFGLRPGCGHRAFRDLLYCINDVLMLHIPSGSYRVLDIDYPYDALVLHDPHISDCGSIVLGGRANGFVVEPWRADYLTPSPDNVFMLIACSTRSSSSSRNCSRVGGGGMVGCAGYYGCPAWDIIRPKSSGYDDGSECCAVSNVKSVNLTELDCQGYSSAYSVAPVRERRPENWSYGILVKYYYRSGGSDGDDPFFSCPACEATGGSCGYQAAGGNGVCLCGSRNSTSDCDSAGSPQEFPLLKLTSRNKLKTQLVFLSRS